MARAFGFELYRCLDAHAEASALPFLQKFRRDGVIGGDDHGRFGETRSQGLLKDELQHGLAV